MVNVECSTLGFFLLIIWISLKLILDIINKDLWASKIFLEKSYEVGPRDKSSALIAALVSSSSDANRAIEE